MIEIDGHHLTIEDVIRVARRNEPVRLSETGRKAILAGRKQLETIIATRKPVYGINTGFGIFADRRIALDDSARLSRNLILSHAVGTGPALPEDVVRAAMLVRANTLSKGVSGVRVEIVETLLEMLNRGVTPEVPSQGSLGSSGDLCQLSHLALVFTTDHHDREDESGFACFNGKRVTGKEAMHQAGLTRLVLGPKEGLAVNNGATFCAAVAALAVWDAQNLVATAEYSLSLSLEAMLGCAAAFDERLHAARGYSGQIDVARHVRELTHGSTLLDSANRVQDAYSLRCAPQVQGAARETLNFVWGQIETELNAATDNPLIFEPGEAISGGNFHGEPVGLAMDYLGIAVAEVGAISERRVFRLTDGKLNTGLPPMLVDQPEDAGLNSGLMMPQYTAASLVLENQTLATPDSVHSLPTSGEQEDHNANAMTAARHAAMIIGNVKHILAVELYTASRAVHIRLREMPGSTLGAGTEKIYRLLQEAAPYQPGDALWGPEIVRVRKTIVENWDQLGL